MNCDQYNLKYIKYLKGILDHEKWLKHRDQIIRSKTCKGILNDLYAEENMYAELMDNIENSGSIYSLEKYENLLRDKYPERIMDMYVGYLKKSARGASDRITYRYLVNDLRKLLRYPDGKEVADSIATEWRKIYSRKPAFMDELKKGGFLKK